MTPTTTTLSDRQFELLEALAAAGAGPAGAIAAIEGSQLFSQDEADRYSSGSNSGNGNGNGGKGKSHGHIGGSGGGGNSNGNGGGEWRSFSKLLPMIKRGDTSQQSENGGVPYSPPTTVNPMVQQAAGGSSSVLVIGAIGALAVGAFFLFRKKPPKQPKKGNT